MKKLVLASALAVCSVFSMSTNAIAQEDHKNIIKLNPLSLGMSSFNISYERILGEKTSIQMGVFYAGAKYQGASFNGYALTPEFRYYMSSKGAGRGFYLAPYARYWGFNVSAKDAESGIDEKASMNLLSGGVNLGTQIKLGKRVALDLFIGPQYFSVTSLKHESNSGDNTETYDAPGFLGGGLWIRGGLNLGISF